MITKEEIHEMLDILKHELTKGDLWKKLNLK